MVPDAGAVLLMAVLLPLWQQLLQLWQLMLSLHWLLLPLMANIVSKRRASVRAHAHCLRFPLLAYSVDGIKLP